MLRIVSVLLASVATVAVVSPAYAEDRKPADLAAPPQRDDEIIVIGKTYGQEVGKTVTPLKDVPNTITVIDREQIEAQNLLSLEDALTAANGITVTGVGSEDPSFMSRGFAINNYLVDGVSTLAFNFPSVVPDLFFYERLEVLRGPAGLFSGSGNPAGSINLVRKRPLDSFKVQASAGAGSWNNFRGELDVSAPLGNGIAARAGVMAQDQDQFFDVGHRFRLAAFGTVSAEIDHATTLTVGGNYDRYQPAIQSGLPGHAGTTTGGEGRLLDIDRSTYLGADWNRFRSNTWTVFGDLTHRVSDRWTLRFSGLHSDVERIDVYSYIGSQAVTTPTNPPATGAPNNGVTNHIAYRGDSFAKTTAFDFNGIGSFPLFGRDQTLILGADYQAQDYDSYYTRLSNYARINVFDPVSPIEPTLNPYGPSPLYAVQGSGANCAGVTTPTATCVAQVYGGTKTVVEQYGLYGQLRLSPFAGLTITGGGRLTWWESNNQVLLPTRGNRTSQQIDGRFTPYVGVVWDATDNLNFYASYADSFSPQAAPAGRRKPDGSDVLPLIGAQFEGGTKLSLMNDKLLVSLAAYQIEQTNRLFNDPDDATVYLQVGKVRARGIEAEIGGEIVPGWRVNGGYSYTKTKYLEDANTAFEGIPLTPIIPEHMVKLFTNYAPVDGALRGFSLGGGVTWFDATYGGNPSYINPVNNQRVISTIVRQGAYAVVDLRAGYKINDRIALSVNANNVLDRNYYARISATGRGNYYGQPRSVFGTIRFTFE
ncbi:TonB-dependent siderophore receptor [Sphingomonas agrestis]|uniref:TonB-dependent siderophore receptor n=1 Tax=Sphingomonas agrestis TaxID=3080540 RepID=UPI00374DC1B1